MSRTPTISDEKAADIALSLSPFERDVLNLCSKGKSWRYDGIARKLDTSYADVQEVGHKLQEMRLAHVSVIPYDGSAIFLNARGEAVKSAVNALLRVRLKRLTEKHGASS